MTLEDELERLGLEPQWRGRYWFIRCPQHEDGHKSAQCFEDGWICCHAGCPRVHINKILGKKVVDYTHNEKAERKGHDNNYINIWLDLELLDQPIKGVPAEILNKAGWRKYNNTDVFIPYFDYEKTKVPFYQIRHTVGERRFTFAKDESPMIYGLEVLPRVKKFLFVTEGSRDSVILRWAGINAVALPSASSQTLLKSLQEWCREKHILLCWCGDRDDAGERLMSNIKIPYIDCRCDYKDIGEMLVAEGIEKIKERYGAYKEA